MSRSFKVRHQWLRDALMDKGLTQRDLAKAWGINEAQVSRYIGHDEPQLTIDRAHALSRMLGTTLDDIYMRAAEKPIPKQRVVNLMDALKEENARIAETVASHVHSASDDAQVLDNGTKLALDDLKSAADKVREALGPGYTVEITIKATGY